MRKIKCKHCQTVMGRERYFAQWWDDQTKISRSKHAFCSADCALTHHDDTPFFQKRIIGLKQGETLVVSEDIHFADGGGNSQGSVSAFTLATFERQDVDEVGAWIYVVTISDEYDSDVEIELFPEQLRPLKESE